MSKNVNFQPRDHREWFLFYLFNDSDFVGPKDELSDTIKRHLGSDAMTVMLLLAPSNGLVAQLKERVASDPASHTSGKLTEVIRGIEDLARRFHISIETVELGMRYTTHSADAIFKSTPFAHIEGDEIVLRMNSKTRLEDIRTMFWYVRKLQEQLPDYHPRNRDKERPDLIYAIYRQRVLEKKTWKEVYELYETGRLPDYDGSTSLTGQDNLRRMYQRFKPDI